LKVLPCNPPTAHLALGAHALAWNIFSGPWLLGAGIFAELEAPRAFAFPHASARVVLNGGASAAASDGDAKAWLAGARLEGCPVGFVWDRLDLRPCVALDLGAVGASAAGVSDAAFWAAGAAHGRLGLLLGAVELEAQAGAILPLTRYEVTAGAAATTLESTKPVGFGAALGAKIRLE